MTAYRRFLPRDALRQRGHATAEVAEAAEVKADQPSPPAEALLKIAEAEHPETGLQQASAEVQQSLTSGFPELQQPQQLQQAPASEIAEFQHDDHVCAIAAAGTEALPRVPHLAMPASVIPPDWTSGVARLATTAPPRSYPAHAWQQLITDAPRFLEDWAQQAVALGWPDWELFGCHRRAPWGRIDGMGLVLLLHGDPLAALTATEAVIRRASGAHQTWRRKRRDPLTAAERCLVWELA